MKNNFEDNRRKLEEIEQRVDEIRNKRRKLPNGRYRK